MAKTTDITNPRTVRGFEYTQKDEEAAQSLGIVVAGPIEDRIQRAVVSYNMAARLAVEAGYLLLSIKSGLAHGEFEKGVEALGLSSQRASELMRMAKFATAMPEAQRAQLIVLPKTKVLALAGADPEVVADLLEDPENADLSDLSVRELRRRIKALEAKNTDLSIAAETAEDKLKAHLKRQAKLATDAEGDFMPLVVKDARAEMAALVKRAELSIAALYTIGVEVVEFGGSEQATIWMEPTLRLGMAGCMALREQLDGLIGSYAQAMGKKGLDRLIGQPDSLAYLDETEIAQIAAEWERLTVLHDHEKALRAHERESSRPKGKGRPKAAPELADAAKPAKSTKAK